MTCACNGESNEEKYLEPLYKVFEEYAADDKNLIPVLQNAQDAYGYLPEKVLKEISIYMKIPLSKVYGVVTFYTQFHLEPRGDNIIRVCMGTACHVRGASDIFEVVQDELGVEDGETTEDLKFTLERVACIGACGLAPVIMVNDNTHGRLTPDKTREVLDTYR